ncbi:HEAT repeat domain-containing protein [Embleya hyalina]|uniref:HEAT repeat-containing protein n=1 Tax=Embleya hyalina TaxID=516124 RepID=A0A401YNM1_9ACTN|nr:HEAT repeat domain-containing protein [Embleya hyalina]GCD96201.1 hypothetical protein EHYA_03885 [Embleya hyalina]
MAWWRDDPAFRAVARAFPVNGEFEDQVGGPLDVRAVVASVPRGVWDTFAHERLPWDRFPCGPQAATNVAVLRSDDTETVRRGLRGLRGRLANSSWSPCALAVPFLLRIAADPAGRCRAEALVLAAETARRTGGPSTWTREEFLRVADGWCFEPSGYPGNWAIEAARAAIATDADLLLPLLDDPDPGIRTAAAHVLAATSGRLDDIRRAFHARLRVEDDPTVRAGLVLAIAQLAHEHPATDTGCRAWARALWRDPANPPEVRTSAAIGWLCLTDAPVPDELRTALDACATETTARLMAPLPRMRAIDHTGDTALHRCLRTLLDPDDVEDETDDPWATPTEAVPATTEKRRDPAHDTHARPAPRDPWPRVEGCADDPPF